MGSVILNFIFDHNRSLTSSCHIKNKNIMFQGQDRTPIEVKINFNIYSVGPGS